MRTHRKAQARKRLAAGGWPTHDLVFTEPDGWPIHPDRLSKLFEARSAGAGLPRIRLHDLRHTHATLPLEAGWHPKIVSERLGHASVAITLDLYSHVSPTLQEQLADGMMEAVMSAPPN